MNGVLKLIGRERPLFRDDFSTRRKEIVETIRDARVLVIGGAGSIGGAVVKELFRLDPRVLHVVDISENNLAELVRDIRSSAGHGEGDFRTFCLDCLSPEFDAFFSATGPYDTILNFSALKHVRSEKDPFTLMRLITVNVMSAERLLNLAMESGARKYFCVSTDKAANPVNMMGASKRIMERFLMRASSRVPVSTSRFANVAFSDGSLLDAFTHRMRKNQPLSAPADIRRYFMTPEESAVLCILATFAGGNREVFFPKLTPELNLISFADIAVNYLRDLGFKPHLCETEDEARSRAAELIPRKLWPCYFFNTDTTGEKDFEEFYTGEEDIDWDRFRDIGVIRNQPESDDDALDRFVETINRLKAAGSWTKKDLVDLFNATLRTFSHKETFKYLDDRM